MKFLCPSCKAKYQIADEKVIGRSVKMKCRQCGHIIEINESVVGASAGGVSQPPIALNSLPAPALAPPPKPAAKSATEHGVSPVPAGARPTAKPLRPAPAPRMAPTGSAALHRNLHAPPPRSAATAPKSATPAPAPAAAPRPAGSISSQSLPKVAPGHADAPTAHAPRSELSAPRPAGARPPASSPSAAGLDALKHLGDGAAAPPVSSAHAPEANPSIAGAFLGSSARAGASPQHPSADILAMAAGRRDALAEAFTSAVGVAPSASETNVGDEWYVGINDSPIGPIPLTELRTRAAGGQVTVDSLVWRDGFEDWKPVRSFPELLAVVEEAISSVYASRGPLAPRAAAADYGPLVTLSPPTERQLPVGTAVSIEGAAGAPAPAVFQSMQVVSPALTPEEIAAATGRSHHRAPKGAWVAVAGALTLGLAIGFVFFRQAPVAPEIKYVEVSHSASAAVVAAAPKPSEQAQEAPIVASAEAIHGTVKRSSAGGEGKATAEANAAPQASSGLKGLQDLRGLGPRSGPGETSSASGAAAGHALDSATLQKTVSRYTASVRRSCWQPALDSRAQDAPTVARVSVKIDIAASGSVSSVSSNGDPKGYRGLASCIESRVRNWSFPPSSGATTVNVPFVFAAQ